MYSRTRCNVPLKGTFQATREQIKSTLLSSYQVRYDEQSKPNEEVDHFIEWTLGALLCRR